MYFVESVVFKQKFPNSNNLLSFMFSAKGIHKSEKEKTKTEGQAKLCKCLMVMLEVVFYTSCFIRRLCFMYLHLVK